MQAVKVSEFGGPEVLKVYSNISVTVPTQTQILVKVKSAGVNPIDTFIRADISTDLKPNLPYIPGYDAAGIVTAVGRKVTKFKVGDCVYIVKAYTGAYAEYLTAEEIHAEHLPDSLTFQQGAAIGIPYYTAVKALYMVAKEKITPDCLVLIHGASGGVGCAAVQLAVSKELKVFGTAGSPEGLEFVLNQGASKVFNHKEEGYVEKIVEASGGRGPDLIIELQVSTNLDNDLRMINKHGLIVALGGRSPTKINPAWFMTKQCHVAGMALYQSTEDEWIQMHEWISAGLTDGSLKPQICKEYKLEEAAIAHHELIHNSGTMGKRVIVM